MINEYNRMSDKMEMGGYSWPEDLHTNSGSPVSNPIPAHSQIDPGLCRSVNAVNAANMAAAAAIAANGGPHVGGAPMGAGPLYSPPGVSSSPPTSSHLSRHHDLLHVSNPLNCVTSSSTAMAMAISAGNTTPTSPLRVPQLKMPRPSKTYHCRMCDQIFENKHDLMTHSQQVHKQDPKPYKCEKCSKSFANSSYLSQHNRIHAGIKPYKCQICMRDFTQLCHLQQHLRTHTGEKPYRCEHEGCPKKFSQLGSLQSHSRSHMTDKPYRCNSCYKCFNTDQELRDHIPKHSETKHLKTHICQICGKSYTQETYLNRHMQKHATSAKDVISHNHNRSGSSPKDKLYRAIETNNHHNSLSDVIQAHHHQQQQQLQHQQQQQSSHMSLPITDHVPLNLNQNHSHQLAPPNAHTSSEISFDLTLRDTLINSASDVKMSAFAPLAHQLSTSGMMNSGMTFPPAAHLPSATPLQHLSSLGSSRFLFDSMNLGSSKRDLERPGGPLDPHPSLDRPTFERSSSYDRPLDMASRDVTRDSQSLNSPFLNLQQIRQYKPPSGPVFPKHEPSTSNNKDF